MTPLSYAKPGLLPRNMSLLLACALSAFKPTNDHIYLHTMHTPSPPLPKKLGCVS